MTRRKHRVHFAEERSVDQPPIALCKSRKALIWHRGRVRLIYSAFTKTSITELCDIEGNDRELLHRNSAYVNGGEGATRIGELVCLSTVGDTSADSNRRGCAPGRILSRTTRGGWAARANLTHSRELWSEGATDTMMRTVISALALAAITLSAPAQACLYAQRPETVGHASGEYLAKVMVEAATYVDLVLVEDDGVRAMGERPVGVMTLRTIARLKGNSADRFTVFGRGMTANEDADRVFAAKLEHFTSEAGQVTPFPYNEERESRLLARGTGNHPPPPPPTTSCSPPSIAGQTGRFYVVMRDREGRVLDRIALSDGKAIHPNHPAFGFVPVSLDKDAFWLWSVRLAAARSDPGLTGPMLIHLKQGSDGAVTERAIRAAGAKVRAAFYDRGGFIEEIRPSPEEQSGPWLAMAEAHLARSQRSRVGDPFHGGAEYLRRHLSAMQRYGTSLAYETAQAFTASVRRHGDAMGAPRLVALEVDGDAQNFADRDFVARMAPLNVETGDLLQVSGVDEASMFANLQRIERDIWLINGGGDIRQGTLPEAGGRQQDRR